MTKKILVIDDDADMLEKWLIVFQASDFEVILSNTGMSGGEIAVIHPDLILLDVQIKGYISTGDEICKEIKGRKDLHNIPIFLISSEPNIASLSIECESDGYISKPFDILKLKSLISDNMK